MGKCLSNGTPPNFIHATEKHRSIMLASQSLKSSAVPCKVTACARKATLHLFGCQNTTGHSRYLQTMF